MVKIVASNYPNKSISSSIRFLILMGQCFALLPLSGVMQPHIKHLKFEWKSIKCLYAAICLTCTLFMICMGNSFLFRIGFRLPQFVEHVFYFRSTLTTLSFLVLARKWPKLMYQWSRIDLSMSQKYGYPNSLDRKLKMISFVVMLLGTVEYLLSIAFHVTDTRRKYGALNSTLYYTNIFPQVFTYHQYTTFLAVVIQATSLISTFSWTYIDLFVIILSVSLAIRFRQVSIRLESYEVKSSIVFWKDIREDYDKLANLTKYLDDKLSTIVSLSFATNLFFILIQLYYSLRVIHDTVEKIYFYYSFGFLIIRTIAVSLYGASINDESRRPLATLQSVPSHLYNNEIKRLLLQISFDDIALSGSKMFKVTRGLLLKVASAIVTYELVLIQFLTNSVTI